MITFGTSGRSVAGSKYWPMFRSLARRQGTCLTPGCRTTRRNRRAPEPERWVPISIRFTVAITFCLLAPAIVLVLGPCAAESQSPAARIGLLGPAEEPRFSEIASALKQGLQEQGYREDTIHVVEGRTRRGDEAGARVTVQAVVGQRVTVLFVVGSEIGRASCRERV